MRRKRIDRERPNPFHKRKGPSESFSLADQQTQATREKILGVVDPPTTQIIPMGEEAQAAYSRINSAYESEVDKIALQESTQSTSHGYIYTLLNEISAFLNPEAQRSEFILQNDQLAGEIITKIFPSRTAKSTKLKEHEIKALIYNAIPEAQSQDLLNQPKFRTILKQIFEITNASPDIPAYYQELIVSAVEDSSLNLGEIWFTHFDHDPPEAEIEKEDSPVAIDEPRVLESTTIYQSVIEALTKIGKVLSKFISPTEEEALANPPQKPQTFTIEEFIQIYQRYISLQANDYGRNIFSLPNGFNPLIAEEHNFTILNRKLVGDGLPVSPENYQKFAQANAKTHLGHAIMTVQQSPSFQNIDKAKHQIGGLINMLCHQVGENEWIFNPAVNNGKKVVNRNSVRLVDVRWNDKPLGSMVRKLMIQPDKIKQVSGQIQDVHRASFTLDPREVQGEDPTFEYEKHVAQLHKILTKVISVFLSAVGTDVDDNRNRYRFLNGKAKKSSTGRKRWFALTTYIRYIDNDGKPERLPFELHIGLPLMTEEIFNKLETMTFDQMIGETKKAEKLDHEIYEARQLGEIDKKYGVNIPYQQFIEETIDILARNQEIPTLTEKPFTSKGKERPVLDRIAIVLLLAITHTHEEVIKKRKFRKPDTKTVQTNAQLFTDLLNDPNKKEKLYQAIEVLETRHANSDLRTKTNLQTGKTITRGTTFIRNLLEQAKSTLAKLEESIEPHNPTTLSLEKLEMPEEEA